jgi:hypothetical protein
MNKKDAWMVFRPKDIDINFDVTKNTTNTFVEIEDKDKSQYLKVQDHMRFWRNAINTGYKWDGSGYMRSDGNYK